MFPPPTISGLPTNPNTHRRPDDGKPVVIDRYCAPCDVKWRGEVREECWSCGELPPDKEKS